jgi:hypothetical protein
MTKIAPGGMPPIAMSRTHFISCGHKIGAAHQNSQPRRPAFGLGQVADE